MQLDCLDHVHFVVPDLQRAKTLYGPFFRGDFVPDYGGPEMNAYGGWNVHGGDFIQPIDRKAKVFGGPPMPHEGMLSVSFRVADVDVGIEEAQAAGLTVRSRVGSEDIGLGKNVVQAQLEPEPTSGLPFELVEHQLEAVPLPLTQTAVDHVELGVAELDAAAKALEAIFGDAFDREHADPERGLRFRPHARLGLRLTSPAGDPPSDWRTGLTTIGFHCTALDDALALAAEVGASLQRRVETPLGREADFEPWAGVRLRWVEREN